jgi:hypothetical protein
MKHDVGRTVEIQYVRAINPPRMTDFYYKHVAFRRGKSPVENTSAPPFNKNALYRPTHV